MLPYKAGLLALNSYYRLQIKYLETSTRERGDRCSRDKALGG